MILFRSNLFIVAEVLLFILKLRENPSIQTFNNHSKQCHGQTEKEHSFLLKMCQEKINSLLDK